MPINITFSFFHFHLKMCPINDREEFRNKPPPHPNHHHHVKKTQIDDPHTGPHDHTNFFGKIELYQTGG